MADLLKAAIEKVMAAFQALHGPEEVPWTFGNLEREEHDKPPQISWEETGGEFSKPQERGPEDTEESTDPDAALRQEFGSSGVRRRRIRVQCWGCDRESASDLLDHLYTATVNAATFIKLTDYDKPDERHANAGVVYIANGIAVTSVPADTEHSVAVKPMLSYEVAATARGQTTSWEFDPNG
jgi:hypothetical protein